MTACVARNHVAFVFCCLYTFPLQQLQLEHSSRTDRFSRLGMAWPGTVSQKSKLLPRDTISNFALQRCPACPPYSDACARAASTRTHPHPPAHYPPTRPPAHSTLPTGRTGRWRICGRRHYLVSLLSKYDLSNVGAETINFYSFGSSADPKLKAWGLGLALFPRTLMLGTAPKCVDADCWNRCFLTPPLRHQEHGHCSYLS